MNSSPTMTERWKAALQNFTAIGDDVDSLQKLLSEKAVFVDEETYSRASIVSEQARIIKILEQRVQKLEKELDAAISVATRARSEKRQAEAAQKAAELHAQEITKELENTSKIFLLHMEELRAKQEEISEKNSRIEQLQAINLTLGRKYSGPTSK